MIQRVADWHRGLKPLGRARFWTALGLSLVAIGIFIVLRDLKTPWDKPASIFRESWLAGRRQWMPTEYYVQAYQWWALVVNLGIVVLLGLTSPLWVKWAFFTKATENKITPRESSATPRLATYSVLIFAILLGGFLRGPQLYRGVLFDEQDNLRRNILGYTDIIPDGEDQWIPATWEDAFFENRIGNNPALMSVMSHGFIKIWRFFSGAEEDQFHPLPLRLPSFLAGLFSFPVLWFLVRRLASIGAANIAVLLFAAHPMVMEYHIQARGYGLTMLFVLTSTLLALKALESKKFLHWLGVAASVTLALYSFSGAIYFYGALTFFIFVHFGWKWVKTPEEQPAALAEMTKFALAMTIAGMVFLQLALPNAVQARYYLEEKFYPGELEPGWYLVTWAQYIAGAERPPGVEFWHETSKEDRDVSAYIFDQLIPEEPFLAGYLFVGAPLMVGFGVVFLWRRKRYLIPIVFAGLAAAVVSIIHSVFYTQLFLYYWYLIYALPFLVIAVAVGLSGIGEWLKEKTKQSWLTLALSAAGVAAFLYLPKPDMHGVTYLPKPKIPGINAKWGPFAIQKVEHKRADSRFIVHPDGRHTREKGYYKE
ncbi:MAG: glycosyltransferase family 39 protein [Verrucomicrobiota bacterium]